MGSIYPLVDLGNASSRQAGLPLSVVDLDRVEGELSIDLAPEGQSYVFNKSGQEIDLGGLICLSDRLGPCANAVKDSQRTKTAPQTSRCLILVWGTRELPGAAERLVGDIQQSAQRLGGRLERVEFLPR